MLNSLPRRRAVLLAFPLPITAALLLVPPLVGRFIDEDTLAGAINAAPGPLRESLHVVASTVETGWFRSTATATVELRGWFATVIDKPPVIELDYHISHGPLLPTHRGWRLGLLAAAIEPRLASASAAPAAAVTEAGATGLADALTMELLVGWDRSATLTLALDTLRHSQQAFEVTLAAAEARFRQEAYGSGEVAVELASLRAADRGDGQRIAVGTLSFHSRAERIGRQLVPTRGHFAATDLRASGPFELAADELRFEHAVEASRSRDRALRITEASAISGVTGTVPLDDVRLDLSLDGVSENLLTQLAALYADLGAAGGNLGGGLAPDPDPSRPGGNLGGFAPDPDQSRPGGNLGGFAPDPDQSRPGGNLGGGSAPDPNPSRAMGVLALRESWILEASAEFHAWGGDHSVALALRWRGLADLATLDDLAIDGALAAATATVEVSLDRAGALASPLGDVIAPFSRQGYFGTDSERLTLDLRIDNGDILLNGERIALQDWF